MRYHTLTVTDPRNTMNTDIRVNFFSVGGKLRTSIRFASRSEAIDEARDWGFIVWDGESTIDSYKQLS
jgi:hypothetical protein